MKNTQFHTPWGLVRPLKVVEMKAPPQPGRIIVVGDVHGCLEELRTLIEVKCRYDKSKGDVVIIVGDYVNKGPDPIGVVRYCKDVIGAYGVLGNHDMTILSLRNTYNKYLTNGNSSYKNCNNNSVNNNISNFEQSKDVMKRDAAIFPADCIEYLASLPHVIMIPKYQVMVLHAGLDVNKPIENALDIANYQELHDILYCRRVGLDIDNNYVCITTGNDGIEWAKAYKGPWRVVFGHDAKAHRQEEKYAIGIDTGCCYGVELTAAIYPGEEIVSVKSSIMNQVLINEYAQRNNGTANDGGSTHSSSFNIFSLVDSPSVIQNVSSTSINEKISMGFKCLPNEVSYDINTTTDKKNINSNNNNNQNDRNNINISILNKSNNQSNGAYSPSTLFSPSVTTHSTLNHEKIDNIHSKKYSSKVDKKLITNMIDTCIENKNTNNHSNGYIKKSENEIVANNSENGKNHTGNVLDFFKDRDKSFSGNFSSVPLTISASASNTLTQNVNINAMSSVPRIKSPNLYKSDLLKSSLHIDNSGSNNSNNINNNSNQFKSQFDSSSILRSSADINTNKVYNSNANLRPSLPSTLHDKAIISSKISPNIFHDSSGIGHGSNSSNSFPANAPNIAQVILNLQKTNMPINLVNSEFKGNVNVLDNEKEQSQISFSSTSASTPSSFLTNSSNTENDDKIPSKSVTELTNSTMILFSTLIEAKEVTAVATVAASNATADMFLSLLELEDNAFKNDYDTKAINKDCKIVISDKSWSRFVMESSNYVASNPLNERVNDIVLMINDIISLKDEAIIKDELALKSVVELHHFLQNKINDQKNNQNISTVVRSELIKKLGLKVRRLNAQ